MENASKALLAAGGVLIAVILLTLIINIFQNTGSQARTYKESINTEEITTFNSNFTKYNGKLLTIYEVVTICNFAQHNKVHQVQITSNEKDIDDIKLDLGDYQSGVDASGKKITKKNAYKLIIEKYDENGYISKIYFQKLPGKVVFK